MVMKNKFNDFIRNLTIKRVAQIAISLILTGTSIAVGVVFGLQAKKDRVKLDVNGLPIVSEKEKAAIEKAKKDSKARSDAEAKLIDSRFFTFESGSDFCEYIKSKMPELVTSFNIQSQEDTLEWIASLAKTSRYFIEFNGVLGNDLHNSDDFAILLKGEPSKNTSFKIAVDNQTTDANSVYDVETKYKDASVDAIGSSSLHERFGITNNDLSHASYIIFMQKPATGDATITFSEVAEYEAGKFGILEEGKITRSNIKKLKEITSNPKYDFYLDDNAIFQVFKFAGLMSWVY